MALTEISNSVQPPFNQIKFLHYFSGWDDWVYACDSLEVGVSLFWDGRDWLALYSIFVFTHVEWSNLYFLIDVEILCFYYSFHLKGF